MNSLRIVATSVAVVGLSALLAAPAQAHTSCSVGGDKGANWTRSYTNNCTSSQARIDRYISSYPTTYLGPWSSSSSYVSSSSGTNSGNYVRANLHGEINGWNRL